jgi:hypothetical protein
VRLRPHHRYHSGETKQKVKEEEADLEVVSKEEHDERKREKELRPEKEVCEFD